MSPVGIIVIKCKDCGRRSYYSDAFVPICKHCGSTRVEVHRSLDPLDELFHPLRRIAGTIADIFGCSGD